MKSAVETLNPTRVRLTVEVPFEELKPSLDAAYKKINQQVTVPGFRKGKIPARVIDQRFGRGAVLEEAINDALPKFYTEAVTEGELRQRARPARRRHHRVQRRRRAEVHRRGRHPPDHRDPGLLRHRGHRGRDRGPRGGRRQGAGAAARPLRHHHRRSSAPPPRATSSSVDLEASVDGEVLEDGVAKGVSYTIGSGQLLDGIDEAVTGLEKGGSATFTSELKGGSAAGREADRQGRRHRRPGPRTARAGRRVRPARLRVRHPRGAARGQPQAP